MSKYWFKFQIEEKEKSFPVSRRNEGERKIYPTNPNLQMIIKIWIKEKKRLKLNRSWKYGEGRKKNQIFHFCLKIFFKLHGDPGEGEIWAKKTSHKEKSNYRNNHGKIKFFTKFFSHFFFCFSYKIRVCGFFWLNVCEREERTKRCL